MPILFSVSESRKAETATLPMRFLEDMPCGWFDDIDDLAEELYVGYVDGAAEPARL